MSDSRLDGRRAARPNIVFGLVLTIVGFIFLLHNLDFHYFEHFWRLWPLALVAIGLAKAFSTRADERTFGWIVTFLGLIFFARYALGWNVGLGEFWPVILVIIGISIVMRAIKGPQPPADATDTASLVRERALVGGIKRKNTSQSFQGGELTAVMGSCEIDLRDARMAGPRVIIDCFAIWGSIVVQIPPDWSIDPQVSVFAAGFEDRTRPPVQPAGTLVLRGTTVMASVEVTN